MTVRRPLLDVRPSAVRSAGAASAAAASALLAWAGGVPTGRALLLGVAAAVVVVALRLGPEVDAGWPPPPPRRTRPGRHTVVVTLRQLEAAVADPGERDVLRRRLAVLEASGPHPVADAVRAATGLSRPSRPARRTRGPRFADEPPDPSDGRRTT